jgi:hypothetical protein
MKSSFVSIAAASFAASLALLSAGCPEEKDEICGNNLDDDGNSAIDCDDEACRDLDECKPEQGCVVDTNFPTRDANSAEALTAGTEVTGTLCPARDDDGWRINVPNPGSVIVVTLSMDSNIITNVTPGYSIAKDNGDGTLTPLGIFASDPVTTPGHVVNFSAAHRVEDAGDYVIVVADVESLDDGFDNVNPYHLTAEVVADPDANEPNNTFDTATPLAAGTTSGIIATSGDQDWYAITVGADAQIVDVTVNAPADSGIEHIATFFADDGFTVLQTVPLVDDGTGTATARLRKPASASVESTILLQIVDGGNDGSLDASLDVADAYTLDVAVLADPDPNEGADGNESIADATTITSGAQLNASLATFADQDNYRIASGTATANAPQVLVVEITFDGTLDANFKPQVQIIASDPEDSTPPDCGGACQFCIDGTQCGEPRLQRFITKSPFKTAYPIRNTRPVFIAVNEFNDDDAQLTGGYTIKATLVNDTDPGEHGDDFLIANLQSAGFANDGELVQQREESKARARQVTLGYGQQVCETDNTPVTGDDTCLDLVQVPAPVDFGFDPLTVDCAEAGTKTATLTGRLTYEGDRDYFLFPDFPARGYFGIEVDYTIDRSTPVELAIFVHGDNGGTLAGSTLEATEGNGCREEQGGQNACTADEVCVDERCWSDTASNPARTTAVRFGDDECVVAGPRNFERPVYIEVVDNGINDFDLDMTYTLNVTVTCGCPAQCDNAQDFCQDG